jgi:two-component system nitrate/nitrite sensor histidine kinase NarX
MLLQTLAGQVNKISQNAGLIAELEFNAIISERTRLAREIHDGLAQTLGFLKLQAAQMENLLVTHDTDRLQERLTTTYKVLSDAYNDVRQAIDGLRISPNGDGLTTWLRETCLEFEENTGLPVSLKESSVEAKLPLEVQAQLIRIVQEALSNVRKHSGATRAWINCNHTENGFMIEIGDDGCGFSLEEVPGVSRYGLQGMRERSDLIGGEIEVISGKGEGTIIRVNLPKYMVRMNSG